MSLNNVVVTGNNTVATLKGGQSRIPRILYQWPTAATGAEFDGEHAANMFALDAGSRKWCWSVTGAVVEWADAGALVFKAYARPTLIFRYEHPIQCNGMYLLTGNDDVSYPHRRPSGMILDAIVENQAGGPQWMRLIEERNFSFSQNTSYVNLTGDFFNGIDASSVSFPHIPFKPRQLTHEPQRAKLTNT